MMTRDDLIEAKKKLYLVFMRMNPDSLRDDDCTLLSAIAGDKDIQKILGRGVNERTVN